MEDTQYEVVTHCKLLKGQIKTLSLIVRPRDVCVLLARVASKQFEATILHIW